MNGIKVTIDEREYVMRLEVGPLREMETMHPDLKGPDLAWGNSVFTFSALQALWLAALMCSESTGGLPRMKKDEAEALMQAYMDEGHTIGDVRDRIGEAGIAGGFFAIPRKCPSGHIVAADAKFCSECGVALVEAGAPAVQPAEADPKATGTPKRAKSPSVS